MIDLIHKIKEHLCTKSEQDTVCGIAALDMANLIEAMEPYFSQAMPAIVWKFLNDHIDSPGLYFHLSEGNDSLGKFNTIWAETRPSKNKPTAVLVSCVLRDNELWVTAGDSGDQNEPPTDEQTFNLNQPNSLDSIKKYVQILVEKYTNDKTAK